MKVTYITKEYPPHVYGGAGVHIENLAREVSYRMPVEVRCFGEQRSDDPQLTVKGYDAWPRMWEGGDKRFNGTLSTFSTDLSIIRDQMDSDLVHTHTWYAAMAGYFAKVLYDIPFVATVHSLEPLRPWKEEQLGRSYHLTSWIEKVALLNADRIIAVSNQSRGEILDNFDVDPKKVVVIHNGIDLNKWHHVDTTEARQAYDLMGQRYILFVGRTSRQKGLVHLIHAMKYVDPGVKLVCCTSAPDTPEVEEEIAAAVAQEPRCVWINTMLPKPLYVELYSQCEVFACPSVYEPFGIINLEAMACERPVVASAVGGIQEVVVPGETGFLVPPADPKALADALNKVLRDKEMAHRFGQAGRKRVVDHFSWSSIAEKTIAMYKDLLEEWNAGKKKK